MKKVLGGLGMIALAAGLIVGGTGAFFSDRETSVGNVFAAGAFDLLIDNESYYNGNKCADVSGEGEEPVWEWIGESPYPVPGTPCTTSWYLDNLGEGRLFFDFDDVKPGDEGEDTISIHIQNDAWACMDMTLTSNDDASSTEPELATGDDPNDPNDSWDGELAQNLQFVWWADDGDNVLEEGELIMTDGVQSLYNLAHENGPWSVALADSQNNVWGEEPGTPLPGGETVYIAKAWCLGELTLDPVAQDGLGNEGNNGPMDRGTGIICDGTMIGNEVQTDVATLDIAFRAVQARHNSGYVCEDEQPRVATLTVNKVVVNTHGGNNVIDDFQLFVVGNGVTPVTSGVATDFTAGDYVVTETGIAGYVATFSGDCNAGGQVTLEPGDNKQCTITNSDLPAAVTLLKNVVGGSALPAQFTMFIDGNVVPQNTSVAVTSNEPHTINESQVAGYQFTSITGAGCPSDLLEPFVLEEGQSITCTITNTHTPEGGGGPIND